MRIDLEKLVPDCCKIGFASIEKYCAEERANLKAVLPAVKTVIVLGHHITNSLEWVWFKFPAERFGETCPADLHAKSVAERLCYCLEKEGQKSVVISYPGECGVEFKRIASRTGLGGMGDNYLFMNADLGPWIHLRVVLTEADIKIETNRSEVGCVHCGACAEECPANAILEDDFNGISCRDSMRSIARTRQNDPVLYECETCLRVCPVGEQPQGVVVKFRT